MCFSTKITKDTFREILCSHKSLEYGGWRGGGKKSVIIIDLGFVPVIISKIKRGTGQLFIKGFSTEQFCDVLFFLVLYVWMWGAFYFGEESLWMI